MIAVEDCLLAALVPEAFEALLRRHPDVALGLLRALVAIIRNTDERITEISTLGAVQRVGRELLRLAGPDPAMPEAWSIAPLPTQQGIASRAGTTRETVARTLAQLAADGVVERRGKALRIPDRRRLEALDRRASGRGRWAGRRVRALGCFDPGVCRVSRVPRSEPVRSALAQVLCPPCAGASAPRSPTPHRGSRRSNPRAGPTIGSTATGSTPDRPGPA